MTNYFILDIAIVLAILSVPAAVAVVFIARFRPAWSERRTVMAAAIPSPMLLTLFGIWMFANTAMRSAEECGHDVCAMTMGASMLVFLLALVTLVFGMLAARLVNTLVRR